MSRFEIDKLSQEQRIKLIGELYDALGEIKNRKEARKVFRDLFTVSEIAMMSRRIKIAILLLEDYTFDQIAKMVGASKGTITRVNSKKEKHGEGFEIMKQNFKKIQKRRLRKLRKGSSGIDLRPYQQIQDIEELIGASVLELLDWINNKKTQKQ